VHQEFVLYLEEPSDKVSKSFFKQLRGKKIYNYHFLGYKQLFPAGLSHNNDFTW
jgi:hypothetical protein